MSQADALRTVVFAMVSDGEIDVEAAMAFLRRTDELLAALSAVPASAPSAPVAAPPPDDARERMGPETSQAPRPAGTHPLEAQTDAGHASAASGPALRAEPSAPSLVLEVHDREAGFEAIEVWGRDALAAAYADLGLFDRRVHTSTRLVKTLGISPSKRRMHEAFVDILTRHGAVTPDGDLVRTGGAPDRAALADRRRRLSVSEPTAAAFLALLAACMDGVADVLRGKINAAQVVFPEGRSDLVEPIYRDNPAADHFNGVLATAVARIAAQPRPDPVRILEIGAGTGGATGRILQTLAAEGLRVQYTYTDVSKGFVQLGEQRFGGDPNLARCLPLDIETPPAEQGIAPGSADIVVASNVLHATRRIDTTLAHTRQILAPGGHVLLNEITSRKDYATMTFGLTDGWWAFEDTERRIPFSPLLNVPAWRTALTDAGFVGFTATGLAPETGDALGQAIIAAHI